MTISTPVKALLASNKHFLDRQDVMESNVRSYPRKLPFAYQKAQGCWVTDVEGNEYPTTLCFLVSKRQFA